MAKVSKLKEARLKRKWSLYKAAEEIGTSPAYLSRLERGVKNNPSIEMLSKIVKVYGDKSILEDFLSA